MTVNESTNNNDNSLRDQLLYLLRGGGAHLSFDDFVADFPAELCNRRIEGLPYTAWQVLEHMRIAQWDILEFCRNPKYVSMNFPDDYWPKDLGSIELWNETVERFRDDLKEMEKIVADPSTDLFAKIDHGDGQTILREALLVGDHNAYHLGALVVVGRLVGAKQ
jgi:hypothetical protein